MDRRLPSVGDRRIVFSKRVPAPATSIPAARGTNSYAPGSRLRLTSGPAVSATGWSKTMLTRSTSRTTPTRRLVDPLPGAGEAGHRRSRTRAAHTAAHRLIPVYLRARRLNTKVRTMLNTMLVARGMYTTTESRRVRMSAGRRGTLPATVSHAPLISSARPNTLAQRQQGAGSHVGAARGAGRGVEQ